MSTAPVYSYRHPHPAVAVDMAIWSCVEGDLQLLLIRRAVEPFKGKWALPGGFLRIAEDLEAAAKRELQEETGLTNVPLFQIGAFGAPDRDPRERVISVAHGAIVRAEEVHINAGTDATEARWWSMKSLPPLAFDHPAIIEQGRAHLINAARHTDAALRFLPAEFTLTELQHVYEAVYGETLDKRNFRKWIDQMAWLRPTKKYATGGRHRPALLYRAR